MSSSKKKILATVSWYPTSRNPIAGSFFKEQLTLLSERYDITLLLMNPAATCGLRYLIDRISGKDIYLESLGDQESLHEYECIVKRPLWYAIINNICSRFTIKRKGIAGLGAIDTKSDRRFWRRHEERILGRLGDRFDLIYGISAQGTAQYAYGFSKLCGTPYILSEHSPFLIPGSVLSDTLKNAMEQADCFLAISNDKIRQILMQNIKLKRIEYIGNMVDEEKFRYEPVPHDTVTFLIVAAHSFYKNYDLFIKTMDRLTVIARKPFRVIIAGYGANKGYSENVAGFEEQIKSSGFADRVEMIPSVSRDQIAALYNRADAFVMTSVQEGQPVAPLEAACCGLPVFSTRCGGVEDYIDDSMGRIAGILDYEKLADELDSFLEGEIVFDGGHIHDVVSKRFGRKAYAENFFYIADGLIGQTHG